MKTLTKRFRVIYNNENQILNNYLEDCGTSKTYVPDEFHTFESNDCEEVIDFVSTNNLKELKFDYITQDNVAFEYTGESDSVVVTDPEELKNKIKYLEQEIIRLKNILNLE